MERDGGVELADLGLDGVVGGAQFRVGGHGFQVLDHAHGAVQRFGEQVQAGQCILEGGLGMSVRQAIQPGPGLGQQVSDAGGDMSRGNVAEGNGEVDIEQRVRLAGHIFQGNPFGELGGPLGPGPRNGPAHTLKRALASRGGNRV